jgi:phage repressor protein C with HTH and peptisase S24 domain
MEPYLLDGDVVLIDLGQKDVEDGDVYALAYGDELRIKRLSRRFDGGLIIRSDNPRFPEETVAANDLQHVRVLGRHIWRGG